MIVVMRIHRTLHVLIVALFVKVAIDIFILGSNLQYAVILVPLHSVRNEGLNRYTL
jgi:hypothetical protein